MTRLFVGAGPSVLRRPGKPPAGQKRHPNNQIPAAAGSGTGEAVSSKKGRPLAVPKLRELKVKPMLDYWR